jgi:CheY-like chemotaxis protein
VRLDGARVLLVEDDADTRNAMACLLGDVGADVTTAASAEEALQCLRTQPFDVMLCDIGLPGEDGYSLLRRARALGDATRRLPALAVSAFARESDRRRARQSGFDGHLAKPVDPDELVRVLGSHVQAERSRPSGPAAPAAGWRGAQTG